MPVKVSEAMAQRDLRVAYSTGIRRRFVRWVNRKNAIIPDFSQAEEMLKGKGRHDLGLQVVRIDCIVGSFNRSSDFDQEFYPRRMDYPERWTRIARAHYEGVELPPIELYKVGSSYFVVDGNHRVSVGLALDQQFIDAHVIEFDADLDEQLTIVVSPAQVESISTPNAAALPVHNGLPA